MYNQLCSPDCRRVICERLGPKQEWKRYSDLRKNVRDATYAFNYWDKRATITQNIIEQWKVSSPNLYQLVDMQSTDFILTSFDFNPSSDGAFGGTIPSYLGEIEDARAPHSMAVKIAQQVNLFDVDPETGEYSLNHEAGHFLYIVKFTAAYLKYYDKSHKNGTHEVGGHAKTDESGKTATKFGKNKDIQQPAPEILESGN